MKFPYEEFHYLKAKGLDDKRPLEKWDGYSTDLAKNPNVYSHDYVQDSHRNAWLINGIQNTHSMDRHLLIFDLDIYKAPDGFDADRVKVPDETPIAKSQNGGLHVYFVVSSPSRAKESDFKVQESVPFDIDIRGDYVKAHVVAPADIPGVGGGYELVNDASIQHVFTPAEAARRIKVDGEPAVRYDPGGFAGSSAGYEREDVDPPAELPKCYGAGLALRGEAPDDPDLNTHKVNVLTALAGLASGYDIETVKGHFLEDYYPGEDDEEPTRKDKERTDTQLRGLAQKLDDDQYSPPSIDSLRQYGILPIDEACLCGLPGHNTKKANKSPYFSVDLAGVADKHGIEPDPYENKKALLSAVLWARDDHEKLEGTKPPYKALVAVAESAGLDMDEPDKGILGENTYDVAKRIFADLEPGEVDV